MSDSHDDTKNPYAAPQSELQSLPQAKATGSFPQQFNWRLTFQVWLVFVGGFALLCSIEYTMRHVLGMQGLKDPSGMNDLIWFSLHSLLAAGSLYLLWLSTSGYSQVWKRLLFFGIQSAVGFVLYAYFGLVYVVYSGIDSL